MRTGDVSVEQNIRIGVKISISEQNYSEQNYKYSFLSVNRYS